MNKGSQWWISGTFITSFIIFCWLIQTSHCLAGWNSVSHPAPYLLVNRELKHLLQPCEFDLWSWWSNFVIVSDIKMHEFLFGNHFLVWGVCFTIFGEGCFNILLVVCMLAFEESFYVTFFFLLLLLHFSSAWHNWWRTAFIILKNFYYSIISQNIPSGDNPFSSLCSLVYRLKVENDKLIWREARSLAFEFYYLIVCPCTNCSVPWENSLSKLVIMMFGKQGELWD